MVRLCVGIAFIGFHDSERNARAQAPDVDCEIDVGQRFVEVIDVEEKISFGTLRHAEIADVAVAAGLHGKADGGHGSQVFGPSRPQPRGNS